jgi:protein-tyrosine phosphatase
MKILMVCLGNICRSPLAEGIMKEKIKKHNLNWQVESAGTSGAHAGELPDPRSVKTARERNIDITDQRSRKFRSYDFEEFDHIFVMDSYNYQDVILLAQNEAEKKKVKLIMNEVEAGRNIAVPDPYYGEHGFDKVFNMLNEACEKIVEKYSK